MTLSLGECELRRFRAADAPSLARNADNPNVAANLRDRFPHPYTLDDAKAWIAYARAHADRNFAITQGDQVIGGIGLEPQADVHARSAELGYWLAEPYWGRGIATRAVRAVVEHAFRTTDLLRIFATVFETNPASARVLEKAGFTLEGRLRHSVVKRGRVLDQLLYAILRDEATRPSP